jgi:hypothetical protein
VGDHVNGEEEKDGGVAGHGERAGEWSWKSWRREDAFEEGARGVYKQGPEDEVPFAEYGLVVLTPEHLKVGQCDAWWIAREGMARISQNHDRVGINAP